VCHRWIKQHTGAPGAGTVQPTDTSIVITLRMPTYEALGMQTKVERAPGYRQKALERLPYVIAAMVARPNAASGLSIPSLFTSRHDLSRTTLCRIYRGYLALTEAQMTAIDADPPFELTGGAVWPPLDVPWVCPHDDAETIWPGTHIVADEQPHKHPQIMKMKSSFG